MAEWNYVREVNPYASENPNYITVEIKYTSGAYEFTENDLDNGTIAAVIESTGNTVQVGKGSDGDPIVGYVRSISEGGKYALLQIGGVVCDVDYAAATEDPDVNDRVMSKGDGTVKQAPAATDLTAGQSELGTDLVIRKDTSNTVCDILIGR